MIPESLFESGKNDIIKSYEGQYANTPNSLQSASTDQTKPRIPTPNVGDLWRYLEEVLASPYVKEIVNSEVVKKAAQGAVIGAVILTPLPLIGLATGASIGAIVMTVLQLFKDNK